MKKIALALSTLFVAMGTTTLANAAPQTLSLGYSQASVGGFNDIAGLTAKYHYQTENPLGIISSFTFMGGEKKYKYIGDYTGKERLKYTSLLAGPSYRFNELFSVYGLVGLARAKMDWYHESSKKDDDKHYYQSGSGRTTRLAYGFGLQIAPAPNWNIDIGYEGAQFNRINVNGLNMGLGYRF